MLYFFISKYYGEYPDQTAGIRSTKINKINFKRKSLKYAVPFWRVSFAITLYYVRFSDTLPFFTTHTCTSNSSWYYLKEVDFRRQKVYYSAIFVRRTYMHCLRTDTIVLMISLNSWFFYHFFFNWGFSFGHPNWSETPWVFRKYMLILSDISIFYFYFKDIHNERTQVWVEGLWRMACLNDFILLLKYVQEKRLVFLLSTSLMDGPILFF